MFEEQLQLQKKLLQELNETLEKRVRNEVAINREKDIMLIQQNRRAVGEIWTTALVKPLNSFLMYRI
jgi:hypothetical protein